MSTATDELIPSIHILLHRADPSPALQAHGLGWCQPLRVCDFKTFELLVTDVEST